MSRSDICSDITDALERTVNVERIAGNSHFFEVYIHVCFSFLDILRMPWRGTDLSCKD